MGCGRWTERYGGAASGTRGGGILEENLSLILWAANGFKKGGSPGMVFVGKYLREIMLEPNLAQLKLLPDDGEYLTV